MSKLYNEKRKKASRKEKKEKKRPKLRKEKNRKSIERKRKVTAIYYYECYRRLG